MDFQLSPQQLELQETVKNFARSQLQDIAKEIELKDLPPDTQLLKKYAEMGLLGINLPKKYGGLGLSHLDAVIVLEEVAKISIAVAFPIFEASFGPSIVISNFGTEDQKRRILPKICSGESVMAVAMSEPEAGSALTDLKTSLKKVGHDFVISGTKRWCSGAGHADLYLVYCRINNEKGANGIGAAVVSKSSSGLTFGKRERHMGFRGIPSADIHFDEVRIRSDSIVLSEGGFKKLMDAFDLERCGNTTMSLACAQSSFDYVLDYVQQRHQFGKPLVDFQAVQLHLAEMKMKLDSARLLLYRAVVNAKNFLPGAGESSVAKCYANEIAREVTGKAMQIMGGYGYSKDFPIEQKVRDAWGWGIAGGAIDIQKTNIAASLIGRRFNQRAK